MAFERDHEIRIAVRDLKGKERAAQIERFLTHPEELSRAIRARFHSKLPRRPIRFVVLLTVEEYFYVRDRTKEAGFSMSQFARRQLKQKEHLPYPYPGVWR